jgi:NAD(P)-dependent dehydrogenase (short-subunit alcohol dehydrogenase family)
MPTAIVTGASRGLGQALARGLVKRGWSVVIDARGAEALARVAADLESAASIAVTAGGTNGGAARPSGSLPQVRAVPGDVTDPSHVAALVDAAERLGDLELVVNNASALGPSPLPAVTSYPPDGLRETVETNLIGPLLLIQAATPLLRRAHRPRVVNITSDASVESYPGWGGYGASKAALDHLSAVLAAEEPGWAVWAVDPGDLRTRMHQDAFPGEDISDRPEPESVVSAFLALVESELPSARLRLSDVEATSTGSAA